MYRKGIKMLQLALLLILVAVPVLARPVLAEEPGWSQGETVEAAPEMDSLSLSAAFSGGPSWDSGWVRIERDQAIQLDHRLGGNVDSYVVDMQYRASDVNGVNQRYYGGADFGATSFGGRREDDRVGAYWRSLTTSSITVYRRPEDSYADRVRVRIWVKNHPDYDSGWTSLAAGAAAITLNHSLGGNANDYVVDMQYKTASSGINQRYFGGADFGAASFNGTREDDRVAAYWRTLTNSTITVFRRAEDDYASQVRIRIWVRPRATYDSGWVALNQDQSRTLQHRIGGDPDNYVVDMQYRASDVNGTNLRYYGGADFGASVGAGHSEDDRVSAYWRTLTSQSIIVYRRPEDTYADKVRIRIWHYWRLPRPDYDSGWVPLSPGASATTLHHNLGGDADDYLVHMDYWSSGSGINQRYYGGSDFGAKAFSGTKNNHRTAAYWRSLTNSTIAVFRRDEDEYAAKVRVRIWRAPRPDYNSGWTALGAGAAATSLAHNLRGSVYDYLVDMQYKAADANGINQRYYGGADFGASSFGGAHEDDRVGAYWRSLNNTSIALFRRGEDPYAPKVRVRIWRMAPAAYDSGWVTVAQDEAKTLQHNLGLPAKDLLVDMWYYDTNFNYTNQRHYGGADLGANPGSGYSENDRVGAYWRGLEENSIIVYRRPEDGFADRVRIRIWSVPYQALLPIVLK